MKMLLLSRLYDAGRTFLSGKIDMIEHFTDNPWDAINLIRDAECILIGNQRFDAALFDEAKMLRILAKQGSGTDNIDKAAAERHGVSIITSPGANAATVAEHVIMLALAASRNLHMYDKAVRSGNFSIRTSCQAQGLDGKVIGLVGYGRIGNKVASLAKAFGMKVAVYDPYASNIDEDISSISNLYELCHISDVISIHVPLTDETRNMFSSRELAEMKPGSVLINCSRGGVVDEVALYDALRSGHLHSAGLDVFASEPVRKDNPLFSLDNIIVTPHAAALTKETADSMSLMTAKGIVEALMDKHC